jgi:hypothetical protein
MPGICRFGGIVIYMYYFDHPPPHFHAVYQGMVMEVSIDPVVILAGSLPPAQTSAVLQWAKKRKADLLADWALAQSSQSSPPLLNPIQP